MVGNPYNTPKKTRYLLDFVGIRPSCSIDNDENAVSYIIMWVSSYYLSLSPTLLAL